MPQSILLLQAFLGRPLAAFFFGASSLSLGSAFLLAPEKKESLTACHDLIKLDQIRALNILGGKVTHGVMCLDQQHCLSITAFEEQLLLIDLDALRRKTCSCICNAASNNNCDRTWRDLHKHTQDSKKSYTKKRVVVVHLLWVLLQSS